MLQLLWADVDGLDMEMKKLPPLSAYRREKINKLKLTRAKKCSAGVELLLIHALRRQGKAKNLPLHIESADGGKPYLHGEELHFNQSHSAHFAACAISDAPFGLDIQILSPCRESVLRRFFAPEERAEILNSEDKDGVFTRLWCRKESYIKMTGRGLRTDLSALDFSGDTPQAVYDGREYRFCETRLFDLFFCVCLPSEAAPAVLSPEKIECSDLSDV